MQWRSPAAGGSGGYAGAKVCGIVVAFAAVLWVAGAAGGEPVAFPLALKTHWTYHLHQELAPGAHFGEEDAKLAKGNVLDTTVVSEVSGAETLGGAKYAVVESSRSGKGWLREWYRVGPEGLLLSKTFDAEMGEETLMVPPQKLLSATLAADETWEWKAADAPVVIRMRVVGAAKVEVPAGLYETREIFSETTIRTQGPVIQVRQSRWFAPGVGYVKQETETRVAGRMMSRVVLTLERFEGVPAAK
jgi:hypothetical protein